ncbi:MAG: histidinol phosphate phosphatase [Planctomycetes bacterium]|nr:histidinol phosphate phosphatase [Planctomycetota bacterium]
MTQPAPDRFIPIAILAAEAAGQVALRAFQTNVEVEYKADSTPVTMVDRKAEQTIRDILRQHFPTHGFHGEEFGKEEGKDPFTWIIDPIDGTKNFLDGVPLFASLIALSFEDEIIVGVCHCPTLGETLAAGRKLGCKRNGEAVKVLPTKKLEDAFVVYGSYQSFVTQGYQEPFHDLCMRARRTRGFGDFYGHLLIASGRADVMIEPVISPWDIAPFQVLIEEAGGKMTSLFGKRDIYESTCLSSSGYIHDEIVQMFKPYGKTKAVELPDDAENYQDDEGET